MTTNAMKNFVGQLTDLIRKPEESWKEISEQGEEQREDFVRYYVPALLLSATGGLFGQTAFGIYFDGELIKPEFGPLLIHTIVQMVVLLLMPFVLAKPLRWYARRLGGRDSLVASRRLIIFAYFPILTFSAFQFLPLLSLLTICMTFYGLYIFYLGCGQMIGLEGKSQTLFFMFSFVAFLGFLLGLGVTMVLTLPMPYPELSELIATA